MTKSRRASGTPSAPGSLSVVLVIRRHAPRQFGVERVFRDVADALPLDIQASLIEVPYASRGILPRIGNILFTARLRADVVHITGDIQYCALAVRPSRCLLTVLDLVSLWRLTGWRRRILLLLWYRLPVRRVAAVSTISGAVRDELVGLLSGAREKTTVIGCPVGKEFAAAPDGTAEPEVFQVLLVGTSPNKNIERVATALRGLPLHIHVVGNLHDEQRRLMDRLGLSYTQTAGLSDAEMRSSYQRSSVLVFASTYEGFGLPILEAQACGTPVVTSCIPPMRDVAGGAAILVDPHDTVSIRRGVEAMMSDAGLRVRLRYAGRLNADRHSPDRIAAQYGESYRRLSSGGS